MRQQKGLSEVHINEEDSPGIICEIYLRELSCLFCVLSHGFLVRLGAPQAKGDVVSVEEFVIGIEGGVLT